MLVRLYKHAELMEESESRVQMSVYLRTPADFVARRMLDAPETYRRWESEHNRLMHTVSDRGHLAEQITALRTAVFALVHRRAVFEYLRKGGITGTRRRRVLALFYGCRDSALAESDEERDAGLPMEPLRPLLKHRLTEARRAILAMPQSPDQEWREVQIRKPNGDTQRMRTIFGAD